MLAGIKIIIQALIRLIQKIIVTISLFLLYVFGFGITAVFMMFFNRETLIRHPDKEDTFWSKAAGYEEDIEASFRQS
jgi:hypothetical protein